MVDLKSYSFTVHSMERCLERIFNKEKPYSVQELRKAELFMAKYGVMNPITNNYEIEEFNAELVVKGDKIVTVYIKNDAKLHKKVTEYDKKFSKKKKRNLMLRNQKNKFKKGK